MPLGWQRNMQSLTIALHKTERRHLNLGSRNLLHL